MKTLSQWLTSEFCIDAADCSRTAVCRIHAVFYGPDGSEIHRDAFWDGANQYKIRFAPTCAGTWHYKICSEHRTLEENSFLCTPYEGNIPLYEHGFVRISPGKNYLVYDDETPFFWLGDTHWKFSTKERWNDSNDSRFESQFRAIVDKRIKQKFTVYQCNLLCTPPSDPDPDNVAYFTSEGNEYIPNLEFFQNNLDPKMAYLAEQGLTIAIGFAWYHAATLPGAADFYTHAVRYLVARYGSYPIVWTLAGEAGGYDENNRQFFIDFWNKVAYLTRESDGYHHPMTSHYTNERPFPTYFQEESWFDFTLGQAGHGDYPIDFRPYRKHRKDFPSKPFVEGESMYEGVLTLEPLGRRLASDKIFLRVAYLAIQNGACGYTYGAQGMWEFQWEPEEPGTPCPYFGHNVPWYEAIDFTGADKLTILKNFYESIHWETLKPWTQDNFPKHIPPSLIIGFTADDLLALSMPAISANEDLSVVVSYFSQTNTFPASYYLPHKNYLAYWFDPYTGKETIIEHSLTPGNGVWQSPEKPSELDMILVLKAIK